MYPDSGHPAPGAPAQNAPAPGPFPGMPIPGMPAQGSAPLPGTFPGGFPGTFPTGPVPMGPGAPMTIPSATKRRPRNWHLALGVAVALGMLGGILSPSGVFGFAWSIATLAALGVAAFFGLKRGEEYRQQRQSVDLARGFAASVPVGQEGAIPTESLVLVSGAATAAATRIYGDRIYMFSKPPAEAEAEAAALLVVSNRAKAELSKRGVDPVAAVTPVAPMAAPAPIPGYTPTAMVPPVPAPQAPAPDSGVTEFILKHTDEDKW
ncbi:MAG: hypothetical protein WCI74_00690 [Actinomycetes bacterium]